MREKYRDTVDRSIQPLLAKERTLRRKLRSMEKRYERDGSKKTRNRMIEVADELEKYLRENRNGKKPRNGA
jgi:DNA-binding ferritin-like protein